MLEEQKRAERLGRIIIEDAKIAQETIFQASPETDAKAVKIAKAQIPKIIPNP